MNEIALSLYLACFAADAGTTHHALSLRSERVHVRETFLTQNPTVNDVIVAAQATGLLWVTKDIKRPWVKWTLRGAVAGLHGYAALHNYQQIQKVKR